MPVRTFRMAASLEALSFVLVLLLAPATGALAYSNVFFFGDSITDTGRNGPGDPPQNALGLVSSYGYDPDRWTNAGGSLWADDFAAALGHSATSRASGGPNYAVGGSRTDELAAQITLFSADHSAVADPGALYVIWSGGNDMMQGYTPAHAVSGVISAITQLNALGATDFLVPNFYDLGPLAPGTGPIASFTPIPAGASAWTSTYATALSAGLNALSGPTIHHFDAKGLFDPIMSNPAAHGFSAGLDLCVNNPSCVAGIGVNDYLMFDHVHLTSAAHDLIAQGALAAIPEPSTGLLLAFGLVGLALNRNRS